jgi:hypothetical protein
MRSAYRVIAYLIAAEVVVQAMAIAYALAGLGHWVSEEGGVLNKAVVDSDDTSFNGVGGFMTHGINGTMVIPALVLILLIVSLFTKLPGATKRAGILVGLVVLQVFLGIFSHEVPYAIMLHALNAFGIFSLAFVTAHRLRGTGSLDGSAAPAAAV